MQTSMEDYRQLLKGRDTLLDALESGLRGWDRIASIAIVYPGSINLSSNEACHAGLSGDGSASFKESGSIGVVSALKKPRKMLDEDEALLFLDWLLNRSPYSSTFITKSAHEALLHKVIISSSHHPSNLMAAGLVASRRLWENVEVARVFADLVKAGVQEDLAFYLGHIARVRFDRVGACDWGGVLNGHCSMDSDRLDLCRWLDHNPEHLNVTYHKDCDYSGYSHMFGQMESPSQWIHQNFPYKGVPPVNDNPFPVPVRGVEDVRSCDYEHFISGMVEFQHKIFEYVGWKTATIKEKAA